MPYFTGKPYFAPISKRFGQQCSYTLEFKTFQPNIPGCVTLSSSKRVIQPSTELRLTPRKIVPTPHLSKINY